MRNKLMLLEELQAVDIKSDGSQARVQECNAQIEALDARIQEARSAIDARIEELAAVDAERMVLEENLSTEHANISRSEVNLKGITTQKEYQAVNKEIASAKKLIAELEEQVLQKIARTDQLKGEIAAQEADIVQLEQNLGEQKAEIMARIAVEEAAVTEDAKVREALVKEIPAGIMKRYEKLRSGRRGLAVAEAREGSCLGCNMQTPPQMYNNLFRGEELTTCPHCQRILVLKQEVTG